VLRRTPHCGDLVCHEAQPPDKPRPTVRHRFLHATTCRHRPRRSTSSTRTDLTQPHNNAASDRTGDNFIRGVLAPVQLRSGSAKVPDPRTICRPSRRQLVHVPIDGVELHRTLGPCGKETASQRSARHTNTCATSPPSESRDHPPRTPDRPAHTTMTDPSCERRGRGRIEPGQRLA
jgi:hypothetical protein